MPRLVFLLVLLALVHAAAAALGDAWPTVSAARRVAARLSGGATVGALCAVSNCERSGPLPSPPGGKFAKFGPYDTRLVFLDGEQTSAYGFPSAVVACPVFHVDCARAETKKLLDANGDAKFPGLAWSSGGAGSCLGTDGFANAADGFSQTVAGDNRGSNHLDARLDARRARDERDDANETNETNRDERDETTARRRATATSASAGESRRRRTMDVGPCGSRVGTHHGS